MGSFFEADGSMMVPHFCETTSESQGEDARIVPDLRQKYNQQAWSFLARTSRVFYRNIPLRGRKTRILLKYWLRAAENPVGLNPHFSRPLFTLSPYVQRHRQDPARAIEEGLHQIQSRRRRPRAHPGRRRR